MSVAEGRRYLLPSGRVVQVLMLHQDGVGPLALCGYVQRGAIRGQGAGHRHRLSLRVSFLRRFGRPAV